MTRLSLIPLAALLFLTACTEPESSNKGGATDSHEHGHHHTSPHGGTLVVLGDHFAHLEIVLQVQEGKLTAFGLDGEAEESLPIGMKSLPINIQTERTSFTLTLSPIANALTGETADRTSEFSDVNDSLVGLTKFRATIPRLTIKGETLSSIEFRFPEGNEE